MANFEIGDGCWIWKDGYLIHDYVFMFSGTGDYILTQSARACRPTTQVFKTVEDGIVWMEQGIRIMRREKITLGEKE